MFRQLLTFLKIEWLQTLEYRADMLFFAFGNCLVPIFGLIVWLAVSNSGSNLPLNNSQLVQYYLLVFLVASITTSWKAYFISEDIKSGNISVFFLKPAYYSISVFTDVCAQKMFRLLFLIPLIFLIGFLYMGLKFLDLNLSMINVFIFIFSLMMAIIVNFLIDLLIGLTAFWLQENRVIMNLDDMFNFFLSGQLIPLVFMPTLIKEIGMFLPYRYMVSFPIEVLQGSLSSIDLMLGLIIQLIWVFSLIFLYLFTFEKGIKSYQGYGS